MATFNVFDSMPRSMGFELHSPLQYQKQEPVFLSFSSLSENYSASMTLSWTGQPPPPPPPPPMDSNVPEWYPESFDVSEHFFLDSPTLSEEALTVTPPEYSSNSFVSLEPVHGGLDASLAPPASPSVWDLTEPLLSSSPGGDCFPAPMTPPPGLHNKASFESFFSCSSGFSEYLATPKLNSTPLVNNGQQQQQQLWGEQSLYSSISVVESSPAFPTGLTPSKTPLLCQGIVLPSTPCPPRNKKVAQLGKLGLGHRNVSPSSQRPFQARQLSETFDQITPCSESSHALPLAPSHLLPPPHIVGNIQGWQSSSPTCSSLLDFNVVATTHTTHTTSTTPRKSSQNAEAGPSQFVRPSLSPLGLTTPPAPKRKRVRSRAASSQKSLFAFHPVDISSPLGTPSSRGYLGSPLSTTSSSAASRAAGSYFPHVPLCSSNNSTIPLTPSDESLAISTPLEIVVLVQPNVPFPLPPCLSSPVPLAKTNNAPVSTRPMAPIPKRRISSNKQSQQQRKSLGETESTTKITFGSFINYTPKDAVALQSAVAPSGTKRRAYSDSEISTKRSRSSSVQSHESF